MKRGKKFKKDKLLNRQQLKKLRLKIINAEKLAKADGVPRYIVHITGNNYDVIKEKDFIESEYLFQCTMGAFDLNCVVFDDDEGDKAAITRARLKSLTYGRRGYCMGDVGRRWVAVKRRGVFTELVYNALEEADEIIFDSKKFLEEIADREIDEFHSFYGDGIGAPLIEWYWMDEGYITFRNKKTNGDEN